MKTSQRSTRDGTVWLTGCLLTTLAAVACAGTVKPKLPPPAYVEPQLPAWQPPSDTQRDSLEDALAGGEWAAEGLGGAPPEPLKVEDPEKLEDSEKIEDSEKLEDSEDFEN